MRFEDIYEKIAESSMPEAGGTGTVYRHIATGARIFCIKNSDINKVFLTAFRTTPSDSTGVAHIMEHSVLCGSRKFPLKDPFVELAKGSLNTFLNAMTYPDKTVYPVASVNDKDFMNLMDVYLDAVFHPNVYNRPEIFKQEGWHYELDRTDGELSYNGVVYNEMKGVFSDPSSVLERYTMHALFPDTTYGFESGGDPDDIPSLSYEEFLRFHSFYYHPSNSYIYLYGDMDMEEKLMWIHENYLYEFDRKELDSSVKLQPPHSAPVRESHSYALSSGEDEDKRCYISKSFVLGDSLSNLESIAWSILEYVLLDAPGAPLTEALVKAGIGEDIYGGYTAEVRQPYFSVTAKNTDSGMEDAFERIITDTLSGLAENGIDKDSLKAALSYTEFRLREADYGSLPKGLGYGLQCLQSWLYDDSPFKYLVYEEDIAKLRELAEGRYFEELIETRLLKSGFAALVSIVPEKGLTAKNDAALREKLSDKLLSMSEEEKLGLVEAAKALKEYQSEEDSEELLGKLPVLELGDIERKADKVRGYVRDGILMSESDNHGIAYITLLFDTAGLTEEELQFASFLSFLLGELDTVSYSYRELDSRVLMNTGGISFDMLSFPRKDGLMKGAFIATLKTLTGNIAAGMDLTLEMLTGTLFEDSDRIMEKLMEAKSRVRARLEGSSHMTAVTRAGSYFSDEMRFSDLTGGIAFLDFLNGAAKLCAEPVHRKRFISSLVKVLSKLTARERFEAAISGDKAALDIFAAYKENFVCHLGAADQTAGEDNDKGAKAQGMLNEGLKTSSQVNYVARSGNYARAGLEYDGGLRVLKVLLNYEYLWFNIRVRGGAYGCMSGFTRSGRAYLVSYRDPRLRETDDIYKALPEYLDTLELSPLKLSKYIIGAISVLDHPRTPSMDAAYDLNNYYCGITDGDLQSERDQILGCTTEKLRSFAAYVRAMLGQEYICTVGNAEEIEKNTDMFRLLRELY